MNCTKEYLVIIPKNSGKSIIPLPNGKININKLSIEKKITHIILLRKVKKFPSYRACMCLLLLTISIKLINHIIHFIITYLFPFT